MAETLIPHDAVICAVTRIFFDSVDGDCHYFEPGELIMACTSDEEEQDDAGHNHDTWGECGVVQISALAKEKFDQQNWNSSGESTFWIMKEDATRVSIDEDARLRAAFALNGGALIYDRA